jgi:hypothetical protein
MLADRLPHGVGADALAVARLRVKGLGRALLRRLVDADLRDRESIREAGRERVGAVLKHKAATAALWAAVERLGAEGVVDPAGTTKLRADRAADAPEDPGERILVVDLRSRRVTYRGHAIPTRPPNNLQRQSILARPPWRLEPERS